MSAADVDERRRDALTCALLIAWVFLVYRGSFAVYFINEDFTWMERCRLRPGTGLWTLLTRDVMGGIYSWRPLVQVAFGLDGAVSGAHPLGYRIATLAWQALATCGVYAIGATLTERTRGVVAAVLFATHPLQVESLSWTCAMSGPMCTALLLLGMLGYLRWRQHRGALALVLGPFALGLATQESAVVFPMLVIGADVLVPMPRLRPRRRGQLYAGMGAVIVVFLLVRRAVSPAAFNVSIVGLDPRLPASPAGLALFVFDKLQRAAALLLTLNPGGAPLPLLLSAAVSVVAIACWWRGRLLALLGLLWVGVALAPYSVLLFGPFDRYMHLPLVGFGLLGAELLATTGALLAHWHRRLALTCVGLLLLLWLGHMVRCIDVAQADWIERGDRGRRLLSDLLRVLPAPAPGSTLAFYGVGELRTRQRVFSFGLEDAVHYFYGDDSLRVRFSALGTRNDATYHLWYHEGRLQMLTPEPQ